MKNPFTKFLHDAANSLTLILTMLNVAPLMFMFGLWILWDLTSNAIIGRLLDNPSWVFWWPFYYGSVDGPHWSFVFDVGMTLTVIGFVLEAFMIALLARMVYSLRRLQDR